jgi:uncharacterized lipoprotein
MKALILFIIGACFVISTAGCSSTDSRVKGIEDDLAKGNGMVTHSKLKPATALHAKPKKPNAAGAG